VTARMSDGHFLGNFREFHTSSTTPLVSAWTKGLYPLGLDEP
jgi:hypothetical protein